MILEADSSISPHVDAQEDGPNLSLYFRRNPVKAGDDAWDFIEHTGTRLVRVQDQDERHRAKTPMQTRPCITAACSLFLEAAKSYFRANVVILLFTSE